MTNILREFKTYVATMCAQVEPRFGCQWHFSLLFTPSFQAQKEHIPSKLKDAKVSISLSMKKKSAYIVTSQTHHFVQTVSLKKAYVYYYPMLVSKLVKV